MASTSLPLTKVQLPRAASRLEYLVGLRLSVLLLFATVPLAAFDPREGFDSYYDVKFSIILVLALILVAWWLPARLSGIVSVKRPSTLLVLSLLLVLWTTVSALLSGNPGVGVWGAPGRDDGLLTLMANLTVFGTALTLRCQRSWRIILLGMLAVAALLSAYGVAQHFGWDASGLPPSKTNGRSTGTFRNPLFFAGYLTLLLPVLVTAAAGETKASRRFLGVGASGLALAALYFTFGRAAWIGTSGSLVLLLAWSLVLDRRLAMRLGLTVAGALAFAAVIVAWPSGDEGSSPQYSLKSNSQALLAPDNPRNSGRVAIWEISVRIILDHPLLGVGPDQMGDAFPRYRTAAFDRAEGPLVGADRAHSEPLNLAVMIGIPGAILMAGTLAAALFRSRSVLVCSRRSSIFWAGVFFGVLGYLAQSVVSITVPAVHTLFFLLLGGLAAAGHAARQGGGSA